MKIHACCSSGELADDASTDTDKVKEENDETKETKKEKTQKRARQSPVHEAPSLFLLGAANSDHSFNITSTRRPFGNNLEAYLRPCYETMLQLILNKRTECCRW